MEPNTRKEEYAAWDKFVNAAQVYAKHLDQWEKVKFDTEYGPVYLSISRSDPFPDSFDRLSKKVHNPNNTLPPAYQVGRHVMLPNGEVGIVTCVDFDSKVWVAVDDRECDVECYIYDLTAYTPIKKSSVPQFCKRLCKALFGGC